MATPCEAVQFPPDRPSSKRPGNEVPANNGPSLVVMLAATAQEVLQCQRLRYRIFAEEMGAAIETSIPGVDEDAFDPVSKHLLVRDTRNGEIVGTTRLLIDAGGHGDGRYYSQTEFDMKNVLAMPGRFMEVGRTCIHPDYRNGSTIAVLWQGLARIMVLHEVDYLIGCASIPLDDGGANAAVIIDRLRERALAAPRLRVMPHKPLPRPTTAAVGAVRIPSLLKAYLRLGAVICGEPCWDQAFNVADVLVLLDRDQIDRRYARHFVQGG